MSFPYTITHESITVVVDGKTHCVRKDNENYSALRASIINEDWEAVRKNLSPGKTIEDWAKGAFSVRAGRVFYQNQPLPELLNTRMLAMAKEQKDPSSLMRFWERLQQNPSWRSVQQLYPFLAHQGICLDEDGFILTYKSVRRDYRDHHSGTIGNQPGTTHEMPRNQISDDPTQTCHFGFHVGALSYAQSFHEHDQRIVICRVDPADVVCVPNDESQRKMRVCKYEVIGHFGAELPSTSITHKELGVTQPVEEDEDEEDLEVICANCAETEDFCECPDGFVPEEPLDDEDEYEGYEADFGRLMDSQPDVQRLPKIKTEEIPEVELKAVVGGEPGFKAKPRVMKSGGARTEEPKPKYPTNPELDAMSRGQLLEQSLDVLRKYATHHVRVVAASKIPGGKPALVDAILKTRN